MDGVFLRGGDRVCAGRLGNRAGADVKGRPRGARGAHDGDTGGLQIREGLIIIDTNLGIGLVLGATAGSIITWAFSWIIYNHVQIQQLNEREKNKALKATRTAQYLLRGHQ